MKVTYNYIPLPNDEIMQMIKVANLCGNSYQLITTSCEILLSYFSKLDSKDPESCSLHSTYDFIFNPTDDVTRFSIYIVSETFHLNPRLSLTLSESDEVILALNQHTAMDPKVIGFTGYQVIHRNNI